MNNFLWGGRELSKGQRDNIMQLFRNIGTWRSDKLGVHKAFVIIFCVLFSSNVFRQAVAQEQSESVFVGEVRSAADEQTIEGASITLDKKYARTDKQGRFTISVENPRGVLLIKHIGYMEQRVAYENTSTASAVRTAPRSISKDLFVTIPATDIRKAMFLDPTKAPANATFVGTTGQGNTAALTYARSLYPSLPANAVAFSYMQFKIGVNTAPGVSHVPNFRSSELLLIEAEAKYFQSKPASEIQLLMNALTKDTGRDPSYSCTSTGVNLLNEIKKYRAIELWGEGYDFFDMKRWRDEINRKDFANGGNFQSALAVKILPSDKNKWKIVTPARETDFNDLIN